MAPYGDPIVGFHRYLDSMFIFDWQQPIRTVRAFGAMVHPANNRIYMHIGGGMVGVYHANRFIQRLEGREEFVYGGRRTLLDGRTLQGYDRYLQPDQFFYAESDMAKWFTPLQDGQERLMAIDVDDRGYVYMAYRFFGWGLAKDDGVTDGSHMQSLVQVCDEPTQCSEPGRIYHNGAATSGIAAIKSTSGRYYALAEQDNTTFVWDVSSPTQPQFIRKIERPITGGVTAGNGNFFAQTFQGQLRIYTADAIANGLSATQTFALNGGAYLSVTSDGANFYAVGIRGSQMVIDTISMSGSSFVVTNSTDGGAFYPAAIKYGGGYLAVDGNAGDRDVRLFKVTAGVPAAVDLKGWIRDYYYKPPQAGFVVPRSDQLSSYGVLPLKVGNRIFLILSLFGLGDVIEIKSGDGIGIDRSPSGDIVYGDTVRFTAKTTANVAPKPVSWNFGNPEAAATNTTTSMTDQSVPHVYSGITSPTPSTRTVTATAPGAEASMTVGLRPPVARFGIANTSYIFAQPNASSPAPIVVGDFFKDLSDGDATGHVTNWQLDGVQDPQPAGSQKSVGNCGSHSLVFTTSYGRLAGLTVLDTPYTLTISPFNYTVRPFAAVIDGPVADASNVNLQFTANARPAGAALAYQWSLLDSADQVIASGSGAGFSVAKSSVTANSRVRLRVSGAVTAGCEGYGVQEVFSARLNPPDPKIDVTGCVNGEQPCTFTAASVSGGSMTGWNFSWAIAPATTANPSTGIGASFKPTVSATADYTIFLTAENAIAPVQVTRTVRINAPTCPQMVPDTNVFMEVSGPGCASATGGSSTCQAGAFSFDVGSSRFGSSGYSLDCAPHTYSWSIDGVPATTKQVQRQLAAGAHSAQVTVSNGSQTVTLGPKSFNVGGVSQPPPTNPPPTNPPPVTPPTGCPAMVPNVNVFATFSGAGCNENNSSNCAANQQMTFSAGAALNYTYECAAHTFSWTIDGQPKSGRTVTHTFTSPGPKSISLVINNSSSQVTVQSTLTVAGGTNPGPGPGPVTPPPGSCQTMVANTNVFIGYNDPNSTCNENNRAACALGQPISFRAAAAFNYNFNCANHTFTWEFPGNQQKTGQNVDHVFTAQGTYLVKLRVSNGSQTLDMDTQVNVGGIPVTGDAQVSIQKSVLAGSVWKFEAKTDPADAINRATEAVWVFTGGPTQETQRKGPKEPALYDCRTWCSSTTVSVTLLQGGQPIGAPANEDVAPPRRRTVGR